MQLTKIILHGVLAEEFGANHSFLLTYRGDLVRALQCTCPSFKRRILELDQQGFVYRLVSGDNLTGENDLPPAALLEHSIETELHLVPVIAGSGAIGRIITGAVLIGAGFLLGGIGASLLTNALIGVGASLALGGVQQLLAPRPQTPNFESQENNTIFGAGAGVSPFRYAVPLVYGYFRVKKPAILSSGVFAFSEKAAAVSQIASTEFSSLGYEFFTNSGYEWFFGSESNTASNSSSTFTHASYPKFSINGTLKNEAEYTLLAAISEGEINGFSVTKNILTSTFLDDTPLQSEDGSKNFGENIYAALTTGTTAQELALSNGNATITETSVNVELEQTDQVVRTISGSYFRVWLTFTIQVLIDIDSDDGDRKSEPLNIDVEIDTDGKGYTTILEIRYFAKTQVPYQQTFEIQLPESSSEIWNIRVTRLDTGTVEGDEEQGIIFWTSYSTLEKLADNLPNTSVLALEVDAAFLGNAPNLAVEIEGIKVKVPNNYTPSTRTYAGAFDGTLNSTPQYTNNPAWILYDLLTNDRYGVGLDASLVDQYSFYTAGVYCDEMVDDGAGAMEPRFTFNGSIVERADAQDILRAVAGSFNAFLVWSGGKIYISQDAPADPVWAFSAANVVVDVDSDGFETPPFEYSQADFSSRFTAANVAFISPDKNWDQDEIEIEDSWKLDIGKTVVFTREHKLGTISDVIEAGLQEPTIYVGNLKSLRTYADVRDAVKAYYMLVTKNPIGGEYYNIGGDYTCEIGDMLNYLISQSAISFPF